MELFRIAEMVEIPFEELNKSASLVVEGVVTPIRAYVSQDGCRVLTDYDVAVSHIHRGSLPAAAKPGLAAKHLTVTTIGGRMQVDGASVVCEHMALRPFRAGQTLLLMLAPDPGGRGLGVGFDGAFEVRDGKVRHLLGGGSNHGYPEPDKAAFLQKLHAR